MDRQIQTTGPRSTKAKKTKEKYSHIYMCKKKRRKTKRKKERLTCGFFSLRSSLKEG
jgi:uncharacterized protein YlaI